MGFQSTCNAVALGADLATSRDKSAIYVIYQDAQVHARPFMGVFKKVNFDRFFRKRG